MQAITQLPQELIRNIISNLEHADFQNSQFISRQWYNVCHLKFLSTVKLTGENIQQFIDSVDSNPRKEYLQAVRHIEMNVGEVDYVLTRDQLEKIFLRFPKLTSVVIACDRINFIRRLDFELCEAFNKDCLQKFEVFVQRKNRRSYFERISNLRGVLTTMDLKRIAYHDNSIGFADYMCGFERLIGVHKNTHLLQNITAWLPLLSELNNIKRISFGQEEDQANFLEAFLAGNQQVTLVQLQTAFSAIEELTIYTHDDYCRNSLLFAATQFNNLQKVKININAVDEWEEPHALFFYEHAFALLNNARNGGKICFYDINDFDDHLLPAFDYIFGQPQTTTILRVFMLEERNQSLAPDLAISVENGVKTVELSGITRFAFLGDLLRRYEEPLASLDVVELQVHHFVVESVDRFNAKQDLADALANLMSPNTRIVIKLPPPFI